MHKWQEVQCFSKRSALIAPGGLMAFLLFVWAKTAGAAMATVNPVSKNFLLLLSTVLFVEKDIAFLLQLLKQLKQLRHLL